MEASAPGLEDLGARTLVEPTEEVADSFLDRSATADIVVIGSTDGRNDDVNVAGAVLRNWSDPTLVVQFGDGGVHLPLF